MVTMKDVTFEMIKEFVYMNSRMTCNDRLFTSILTRLERIDTPFEWSDKTWMELNYITGFIDGLAETGIMEYWVAFPFNRWVAAYCGFFGALFNTGISFKEDCRIAECIVNKNYKDI